MRPYMLSTPGPALQVQLFIWLFSSRFCVDEVCGHVVWGCMLLSNTLLQALPGKGRLGKATQGPAMILGLLQLLEQCSFQRLPVLFFGSAKDWQSVVSCTLHMASLQHSR